MGVGDLPSRSPVDNGSVRGSTSVALGEHPAPFPLLVLKSFGDTSRAADTACTDEDAVSVGKSFHFVPSNVASVLSRDIESERGALFGGIGIMGKIIRVKLDYWRTIRIPQRLETMDEMDG